MLKKQKAPVIGRGFMIGWSEIEKKTPPLVRRRGPVKT
jgi:hypothetical protein